MSNELKHPKRGEKMTVYNTKVQKDKSGELFIELPGELTEKLGWRTGDKVEWDVITSLGENFDDEILSLRNLTQETDESRFKGHEY